jgi:hypothetical protein
MSFHKVAPKGFLIRYVALLCYTLHDDVFIEVHYQHMAKPKITINESHSSFSSVDRRPVGRITCVVWGEFSATERSYDKCALWEQSKIFAVRHFIP